MLTKPLGTGALAGAFKKRALSENDPGYAALVATMTALNACGMELAAHGVTACTDVTGFGLTGHAGEMARGGGVQFVIETASLPLLPDAIELCGRGFTCGGTADNRSYTGGRTTYAPTLGEDVIGLLNDPQTSGGLLFSVPADRCEEAREAALAHGALCAAIVGEVREGAAGEPDLRFV